MVSLWSLHLLCQVPTVMSLQLPVYTGAHLCRICFSLLLNGRCCFSAKKNKPKNQNTPPPLKYQWGRNKKQRYCGFFFLSFLQLVSSFQTVAAVFVGVKRAGPSTSETADLQFSWTTISSVQREWCEKQKISNNIQLRTRKCAISHMPAKRGLVDWKNTAWSEWVSISAAC